MDFVLCVLIIPHVSSCPKCFWGQFWGQNQAVIQREVFSSSAHLSAQLWSHCEHQISLGWYKGRASRYKQQILLFSIKLYTVSISTRFYSRVIICLHHHSLQPVLPRERPLWGQFPALSAPCPPHHCDAWSPPFCGDFLYHNRVCLCGIFLCR